MSNRILWFSRNDAAYGTQPWRNFFRCSRIDGHGQTIAPRLVGVVEPFLRYSGVASLMILGVLLINTPNLPHVHEDHAAHFGDSCQSDPCHMAIYHHGSADSCDHKYHLTAAEEDCPFCHLIPMRQIAPELAAMQSWLGEKADRTFVFVSMQAWSRCIIHADRGPPSLS